MIESAITPSLRGSSLDPCYFIAYTPGLPRPMTPAIPLAPRTSEMRCRDAKPVTLARDPASIDRRSRL